MKMIESIATLAIIVGFLFLGSFFGFLKVILSIIVLATIFIYVRFYMPLRPEEDGFKYVYIETDGTAREIDEEENEYLNTKFEGSDGARPYIKHRYSQLTPDKKIHGFLPRRRLPRNKKIKKTAPNKGYKPCS